MTPNTNTYWLKKSNSKIQKLTTYAVGATLCFAVSALLTISLVSWYFVQSTPYTCP